MSVVRDTPDTTDAAALPAVPPVAVEPAPVLRRFELDPASSPTLLAALAWDAAPRR